MNSHFYNKSMNRRTVLRGAGGALLGLPMLDAMTPAIARADSQPSPPKRFLAICATLGFHGPHLFPSKPGEHYTGTAYLEPLKSHRENFTLFSGLSHPEQQGNNGHASELTWLTSARRPGLAGFKNSISIDQLIARQIGHHTRFPYLALSTSGRSMSWSSAGVEIPATSSPARLFQQLFIRGSEDEIRREMRELERGRSILDTVLGQAKKLHRSVGSGDQGKLDEYLTAVRDLETRLKQSQDWVVRDKPDVEAERPKDINDKTEAIARQELMYDMIVLALKTDSTRTITFQLGGLNAVPKIPGVSSDWHQLSHHGKDPSKIDELKIIEIAEFSAFARFLDRLKQSELDSTLLDQTAVLFGSNLGNASSHDWHNLPIILAGGGYRHGRYVAHDADHNTPLSNMFVPLARRMGLEIDAFGSSTSDTIRGLDT